MSNVTILLMLLIGFLVLLSFQFKSVENFHGGDCWCRGGISSSNTKAYAANLVGPWPNKTGSLTLSGGTQVWNVSGSAWSNTVNGGICKLNCVIDGAQTFTTPMFINAANTHTTFPSMMFTTSLPAGAHTFAITMDGSAGACVSDVNDTVQLSVIEFPK